MPAEILQEQPLPGEDENAGTDADLVFGFAFPDLVDTPLIVEDELVEDPVTSGGDSALYASPADDENDEENDDER